MNATDYYFYLRNMEEQQEAEVWERLSKEQEFSREYEKWLDEVTNRKYEGRQDDENVYARCENTHSFKKAT